jgi:putative ABC transport system ATP-binding protein
VSAFAAVDLRKRITLPSGEVLELIDQLSLDVSPGEVVAVQGRSGSGKTTLLSVLGLLNSPDSGELFLGGVRVTGRSRTELARIRNEQIGFVFQNYSLIGHFTALQNVQLPFLYGAEPDRGEFVARARECLEMVGLGDRAKSYPAELSGGEQQRVAIARAMVRRPALVLADEPTGALDEVTAKYVLSALIDQSGWSRSALVLVTHDPVVAAAAHRRYVLSAGRLTERPS